VDAMRIAFLGTRGVPASYSGFETCVEQVGRRMVERGHEVIVYCRRGHSAERASSHLGMRLVHLPSIRSKHLDTLSHTALSALRLPRQTAVICMGVGNAPVVRAIELTGRRTVFNVDGADWQRAKWGRAAARYLRTCERIAARSRSLLVADAEVIQRSYQERFGRQTELVAYGADPPLDTGRETLDELGLQPGGYVLFVGRLVPENGAHDFLEGMARAGLDVPAVVVGDAPYQEEYIAGLRTGAPASTVFAGYRFGRAYQQLTANAGLYVLAATVGGTHPVLIEQMAAGNCVLARDTGSDREVMGDAGRLWRTPEDLAGLLGRLWPDQEARARLGAAAHERVAERYRWSDVTDRYLDLCERSLTRASARAPVNVGRSDSTL
jgi:glycosyltransferase involved in cell wall biosynthesis